MIHKNAPDKLTAIIRCETPLMIDEPCSYRRVTIHLTDAQREAMELKSFGAQDREQVSNCFLEFPN